MSKGLDTDVIECPTCGEFAYILEANVCELCGESVSRECSLCGDSILPEELTDNGMCGWCSHMIEKRLRE